ncbi:hypothetical protein ACWCQJ_34630, partial [Streptomyces olivaceus]
VTPARHNRSLRTTKRVTPKAALTALAFENSFLAVEEELAFAGSQFTGVDAQAAVRGKIRQDVPGQLWADEHARMIAAGADIAGMPVPGSGREPGTGMGQRYDLRQRWF